jgi:hypothetical protein
MVCGAVKLFIFDFLFIEIFILLLFTARRSFNGKLNKEELTILKAKV